ncbi:hypothetical protein [Chryseobacterium sp.]|uniref:hypothetical protein n=1 Tax=Chryseobacterium sp. TaxID=1871047 RepID=UPI002897F091|nr:hypothetical protein [Chryseobacterium sp.]
MNARVLELLKEPKKIQKEDLQILKNEIQTYPYLQNVRALHLYGIHLYDSENYQKELSKTAAYTTDKKNLYHLINGNIERTTNDISAVKNVVETKKQYSIYAPKNGGFPLRRVVENPVSEEKTDYTAIQPEPELTNKPVVLEGERNRILFEGEENFLNEDNKLKIDLESSIESGNLVTEKARVFDEVKKEETVEKVVVENENQAIEEENNDDSLNIVSENAQQETEIQEISSEYENETIDVNFDQSEIKVSPQNNLEEAFEIIAEDQAVSFQEIEPLETEIKTEEISIDENTQEITDFTPETIISEGKIESEAEKDKVEDDAQLSFHGTDSFLPDVKIESATAEKIENVIQPTNSANKYEDEMRRLIEQVEQKMKESKKDAEEITHTKEEENVGHFEISFAETQSFDVISKNEEPENVISEVKETPIEISNEVEKTPEKADVEEVKSSWKPMSFESNTLDSAIGKAVDIQKNTAEKPTENIVEQTVEEKPEEVEAVFESEVIEKEEIINEDQENGENKNAEEQNAPAFNLSFFGNNISAFSKAEEKAERVEIEPAKPVEIEKPAVLDSNIPDFINTWQSWLKIDRIEETEKEKAENKAKTIDSFIENNPKISQLKDESSFVVKERNDDISHLMTETLAKLYTEQKLYTKSINAYQILIEKHPDKKSYFEEKIQEVKDIRGRN